MKFTLDGAWTGFLVGSLVGWEVEGSKLGSDDVGAELGDVDGTWLGLSVGRGVGIGEGRRVVTHKPQHKRKSKKWHITDRVTQTNQKCNPQKNVQYTREIDV